MPLMPSAPPLTLPPIAPPLPDVGLSINVADLVVVCPLAHHCYDCRAVKHDKGELCQVDLMDLLEDLLPHARVRCRLLLFKEGIQSRIAVECKVASIGRELVAREYGGIVGVISRARSELGDVIPAGHGSRGRRCLSPRQEGAKEWVILIVLDVELDANLLQVALDDRFNSNPVWIECDCRRVLELQVLAIPGTHPIGTFHP